MEVDLEKQNIETLCQNLQGYSKSEQLTYLCITALATGEQGQIVKDVEVALIRATVKGLMDHYGVDPEGLERAIRVLIACQRHRRLGCSIEELKEMIQDHVARQAIGDEPELPDQDEGLTADGEPG